MFGAFNAAWVGAGIGAAIGAMIQANRNRRAVAVLPTMEEAKIVAAVQKCIRLLNEEGDNNEAELVCDFVHWLELEGWTKQGIAVVTNRVAQELRLGGNFVD